MPRSLFEAASVSGCCVAALAQVVTGWAWAVLQPSELWCESLAVVVSPTLAAALAGVVAGRLRIARWAALSTGASVVLLAVYSCFIALERLVALWDAPRTTGDTYGAGLAFVVLFYLQILAGVGGLLICTAIRVAVAVDRWWLRTLPRPAGPST